jgi:acyl-CoA synthetase (NDP forming)
MAKETQRSFDTNLAAVIVSIEDEFGNLSLHTIHLFNVSVCPACGYRNVVDGTGDVDVNATVAAIITDIDASTAKIKARMIAAGWTLSC